MVVSLYESPAAMTAKLSARNASTAARFGSAEAVAVGLEPVAQQRRPGEPAHERRRELVERVREDHDLVAAAKPLEKAPGAFERRHLRDDVLDRAQAQAVLGEQREPAAHELVVIGLVARRARQRRDAGSP
jgi:hypothetical protein